MKSIFIAAALIVGTPAFAQDMSTTPPAAPATDQGSMATPAPAPTPAPTPDAAPMATPPAAAPAPATATPAFTPTPVDSSTLPTCSKKIKDKCINPGAKK